MSTSTSVIVISNIYDQKTVSTRPFTFMSGFTNSWQIAYPIQIRWKAEGLSTTSSDATVSAGTVSRTGVTASSTSTATATRSNNEPSHSKLSTGAIVGIAIGAFVFFALLAAAILFVYRNRKRRPEPLPPMREASDSGPYLRPELDTNGMQKPANIIQVCMLLLHSCLSLSLEIFRSLSIKYNVLRKLLQSNRTHNSTRDL